VTEPVGTHSAAVLPSDALTTPHTSRTTAIRGAQRGTRLHGGYRNYSGKVRQAGDDDSGYTRDRLLGQGGSAAVYLAHRSGLPATVALKVLHPDKRGDRYLARLHREFDFARQVHHEHVVAVYEHGTHWLTMQYIDGGNTNALPGLPDRVTALTQIAGALDHVHRVGIVHCDVKPTNILVFQDFSRGAVLIDFGIAHSLAADMAARLSHAGLQRLSLDPAKRITHQDVDRSDQLQASLPYASPEILMNQMPSAASDQYSLACTAVELLTGEPPFAAQTQSALIDAHVEQPVPRLSTRAAGLPRALDSIVARAMAKDPDRRYSSCAAFIDDLTHALSHGRTT
jgi:eukaryotic-like serine/threonine-protein kinase